MKKKKNNNEFNAVPPYTQIEEKLAYSKASEGLMGHTMWLYVIFRLKYRGDNPRNITFTQKEAKKIMRIETFRNDYRKLIERGFIDLIKCGGFYKEKHIFGLSNRWRKYGTKDFVKVDIDKHYTKIFKRKWAFIDTVFGIYIDTVFGIYDWRYRYRFRYTVEGIYRYRFRYSIYIYSHIY